MLLSPGFHIAKGYAMRPYQIRAAQKLFTGTPTRDFKTGEYIGIDCDGTNIHIDMGLGKTIIGLTAIADWYKYGVLNRPTLLVAPIKVCETVWRQEAQAWTHTRHLRIDILRGSEKMRAFKLHRAFQGGVRHTDVILINPELLGWLFKWIRNNWGFFDALLIDDVPLKNPKSKQFRIMSNYGRSDHPKGPDGKVLRDEHGHMLKFPPHRFKRAGKMTGTPSTNGLHNVWSTNYLMDHGARLHKSYDTFESRFFHKGQQVAEHIHKVVLNDEEGESRPEYAAREGAPERIHELIADVTIELDAADYGVLPNTIGDASKEEPPHTHIHRVELPGDLRPKYDELERDAILELMGDTLMAQNGGAKSMMCWQFANGAIYKDDDFGRREVQHLHDAKLDKMVELIERVNGNVIIPYYFKHDFARIVARLDKEKMHWASLKGSNTERIINQWNAGDLPILLLHPQSAGHGLNLQFGGCTFIWFTMLWSLERYLQTNARLARSGQERTVHMHHIITERTTDELMLMNLRQNGTDQARFRAAIREYQTLRGISYV